MFSVIHLDQALLPGMLLLLAALVVLPGLPRENQIARTVLVLIASIFGLRYLVWRATETLPPLAASPESLWMWAFFVVEALAAVNSLYTYLLLCRWRDRSREADAGEARLAAAARTPTVDVLIPTYNEGPEILERTITGALAIDYPQLTVWVLDDGDRDWLRDLSERLGARYLRRAVHDHAKAGNINHALGHCHGEFLLVLDADFVANRRILWRVIGLFDDPRIGAVQTPQVFFNPDPIQNNLRAAGCWVDEQRFFFDILQPAKDAWDTAFCCGTSAVLRRAALDAIGGFPTETVTEDIHVTYKLYEVGYVTRYLNEPLSKGMAAEGISEYLLQRSRWCLGTLQQLFLRTGPFGRNQQTLLQRIGYISGALFWVLFVQKLLFVMAPVLFWYFGVPAFISSFPDLLFYYLPSLIAGWALLAWASRWTIFPVITDASQLLSSVVILRTVVQTLVRPFGRPFKVTPKGGDRTHTLVHWDVVVPAVALVLTLVGGMALNTIPEYAVVDLEVRGINIVWTIINIILLIITALVAIDLPRPRREERFQVNEPVIVWTADARIEIGRVLDLSLGGARIEMPGLIPDGVPVRLRLHGVGVVTAHKTNGFSRIFALRFEPLAASAHRRLIEKLYTRDYPSVAQQPLIGPLVSAVWGRMLG